MVAEAVLCFVSHKMCDLKVNVLFVQCICIFGLLLVEDIALDPSYVGYDSPSL